MSERSRRLLYVWLISLGVIILGYIIRGPLGFQWLAPLRIGVAFAWILLVLVTLVLLALAVRLVLRKLFWRVGRRLALSYFLIGVLPFVFFAILLFISGYMMGGVLSQATLRMERVNTLTRMEQWNLEYALTGAEALAAPESVEFYDSQDGTIGNLPEWLRETNYTGLLRRDDEVLFAAAKIYQLNSGSRSIVLTMPLDREWGDRLYERTGMAVAHARATASERGGDSRDSGAVQFDNFDIRGEDGAFGRWIERVTASGGLVWWDMTPPLNEWENGEQNENERLLLVLMNPWMNLFDFYTGGVQYVRWIGGVLLGVTGSLALLYFFATLLAAAMIFSITRAINRIDRGTKAVEHGDFSYRIQMRASSQLGEVALSFNRMTASIGELLGRVAEQERLKSEINIAAAIQRNLLPRHGPELLGVSFAAHFEPTAEIGGDYYDLFHLERHRLGVAIGDVSGHGLSTGLVMAMVKAAITTLVEEGADEAALFHRLNDLVTRSTEKRTFMTLGFSIFDLEKRTLRHTNAGHLYPYLVRAGGEVMQIEAPSLPLGLRPEIHPETVEVAMEDGDLVIYLSDGIIEAQNESGEPLGFERLEQLIAGSGGSDPAEIKRRILTAVIAHSGERPADDDRTIMILRFEQLAFSDPAPLPDTSRQLTSAD
jgi:serine phosphatase RsbU (regulator of sigma subunit)